MKKNKKKELHLCNADDFVVVVAVREDEYGKTAYIFEKYKDEEAAKKAIEEGGLSIERYRLFKCNHLKDFIVTHDIKEVK